MRGLRKIIQPLVVMIVLTCMVLTSCKPITHLETTPSEPNDLSNQGTEVIDSSETEESLSIGVIDKITYENGSFSFYFTENNVLLSGYNLDVQSSNTLIDITPITEDQLIENDLSMDDDLRTTLVKSIDGYMKGLYYAKDINDTLSTVVFIDDTSGAHMDLLEIEHAIGSSINDVQLSNDFNTLYYTIKSETNLLNMKHYIDENRTIQLNDPSNYVLATNEGIEYTFDRNIQNNSMTLLAINEVVEPSLEIDETIYDLVILNGIVTDPDTNTYKFGYNIGIIDNEIATITETTINGNDTVDASGLIVSPGFIDMLGFNMNTTVAKYKITDGVTTNMSLHGCTNDFEGFFEQYGRYTPYINYGGAVFAIQIRYELGLGAYGTPTEDQIVYMANRVREEIEAGGVALAFSPEYYPGTTPEEIRAMMAVAAEYNIPTHFHTRYSSLVGEHTGLEGVIEVIDYARELDARVQIMHLHSTGGTGHMEEALQLINDARAEGVQISYDIYPYDSWASNIDWQRYNPGWQERYDITYEDLQMAGTADRLTEETFNYYRQIGGLCIAFAMDEDEMLMALSEDYAMVGSDGNIDREDMANNHFRGAGTFSRILGRYVREEDVFSLMDGIQKMTINAARHLEPISQDMALRGRLQEGCIADITIFDYRTILDQSTPEDPSQESAGIECVIVSGQIGLRDGQLLTDIHGGQAIMSDYARD